MLQSYTYGMSYILGRTSMGKPRPIMFNPQTQIWNREPPGIVISGAPGKGKTYLALALACYSSIGSFSTIILDPKGDFMNLRYMNNIIGKVRILNLAEGNKGLLDPFYMADDLGEKTTLALEIIDMLLGGLSKEQRASISPTIRDVAKLPKPSLALVKDELRMEQNHMAKAIGEELEIISHSQYAKLCFTPGNSKKPTLKLDGTIIITMPGIELRKSTSTSRLTVKERFSNTIFYLITDFLRRIMHDGSNEPKTLIIDEAWSILSTEGGSRVVEEVARLGRSLNISLILVTQNDSDLKRLNIENTIATRFAFQTSLEEGKEIIKNINLPDGMEHVINTLEPGECLFSDFENRVVTMKVQVPPEWDKIFRTNPNDKRKLAKEREEEYKRLKENL